MRLGDLGFGDLGARKVGTYASAYASDTAVLAFVSYVWLQVCLCICLHGNGSAFQTFLTHFFSVHRPPAARSQVLAGSRPPSSLGAGLIRAAPASLACHQSLRKTVPVENKKRREDEC